MLITPRTHVGLVRSVNQDALLIADRLYGVADGMGGHNGGETASKVASQVVIRELKHKKPDPQRLREAVEKANQRVFQMQLHDRELSGMGTTVSVLWEDRTQVHIAQVGDSRVYLLRQGILRQVTHDHSYVQTLVDAGIITEAEAFFHPRRNIITRAVGIDEEVQVDLFTLAKKPNDLFLICSDGLSGMVTDDAMCSMICDARSDEEAAEALMAAALGAGGNDNVSFVLCREEANAC